MKNKRRLPLSPRRKTASDLYFDLTFLVLGVCLGVFGGITAAGVWDIHEIFPIGLLIDPILWKRILFGFSALILLVILIIIKWMLKTLDSKK